MSVLNSEQIELLKARFFKNTFAESVTDDLIETLEAAISLLKEGTPFVKSFIKMTDGFKSAEEWMDKVKNLTE